MSQYFSAEFFSANRRRLQELCPEAELIIVAANGLLQRNGDVTYPYRQDSSFWYLTGLNDPDIHLVIDRHDVYLIIPEREAIREIFDGALNQETFAAQSGIETVLSAKVGWEKLNSRLKKAKSAATLLPAGPYIDRHGFYVNPAKAALVQRLKEANPNLELQDARPQLTAMRMIKQQPELQVIQQAIDITITVLRDINGQTFKQFSHEYEIEAALSDGFRKRGAAGHAFAPIVASGQNACRLHYVDNNDVLDKSGLLILDVGAEISNYAADISRTYAFSEPTDRQRAIHGAVLDVQQFAASQLKPGVLLKEYEKAVEQYMGEKLLELRLIDKNEHQLIRRYYPHATSHFLGLDTHDVGDYQRPLEPGIILTVEPGIYIPEEGIGVRIEDNILITKGGTEVLSKALSRSLQ